MIKAILWDIDNTLLDFEAAEKAALNACFASHSMGKCSDEMRKRYMEINRKYWEGLERGEISKAEVLVGRFKEFFELEGLDVSVAEHFNQEYQIRLGDTCVFMDRADELVKELKQEGYLQFAVTNGTKLAQERKLENSGLGKLFDGVFISEEIGIEKPMSGFFDCVFEKMGEIAQNEMIIVGDSLTSDMRGGNNAHITNCWYNPGHKENHTDVVIDYEIDDLWKIKQIIKNVSN